MCQLCVCLCLFVGTQVSAGTRGGHKRELFPGAGDGGECGDLA